VLSWRTRSKEDAGSDESAEEAQDKIDTLAKKRLDFSGFRPETAAALDELADAFTRDYVKWWYHPIIPEEQSFPTASRQMLVAFLVSISNYIYRKRPADTFLNFLTNSSSILIVFLNELSLAVAASPNAPCAEAVQTYLRLKPDSNLANVLDTRHQEKKLDLVAQDILECYLDTKAFNCEPVRMFTRQILAKVVMEMTITSCSKPEFINGWIVYLLEDGEPELMKDIDAGLQGVEDTKPVEAVISAEKSMSPVNSPKPAEGSHHKRTISKAQEAMDEAMREAQRLTQLMLEDDARRQREQQVGTGTPPNTESIMEAKPEVERGSTITETPSSSIFTDDASESTTQGIVTPTSSQSDMHAEDEDATAESRTSNAEQTPTSPTGSTKAPFTSFDQLVPQQQNTAPTDWAEEQKAIPPLTLHNANITIFDDTDPSDRAPLRQKPLTDYLIQIEPASTHYSGWMIVRKYADFETLHEVLRRIAAISGAAVFAQAHPALPNFKAHTKATLREVLERYLSDAMRFQSLAESEGMKRFLEKERGLDKSPNTKSGFAWPTPGAFEKVGKGMLDVLTQAPKEVAGGGKALIGGVSGVLSNKKRNTSIASVSKSVTSAPPLPPRLENISQISLPRHSTDSLRGTSPVVDTQPAPVPPMERKPSTPIDSPIKPRSKHSSSRSSSRPGSTRDSMEVMPVLGGDQIISLPPRPSDIPEDYNPVVPVESSVPAARSVPDLSHKSTSTVRSSTEASAESPAVKKRPVRAKPALNEQETQMVVELMFATITELYQLSSAWALRKTLLTAAKTFLLRPGNPQLESIRQLLQTTVIDANTSDEGIALHLRKIRENALPTEDELKAWPPEPSDEEKEKLRKKARKLLVERGMPQALTSVMGQAASGEALGKVFDCLQISNVARGLVFGLMLQGMRAITQ
jgi:hypothetical protein